MFSSDQEKSNGTKKLSGFLTELQGKMTSNGLICVKGDFDRPEVLSRTLARKNTEDLEMERKNDVSVIAPSTEIRQEGCLVGFNGYLMEEGVPEEILAEKYMEEGISFLENLNGSFRLVLYDIENDRLHISSDKAGRKVIYYHQKQDSFVCSSHLLPVLRHPKVENSVDRQGISEFLQSWSVSFGGGNRLIQNVKRLEPSHRLVLSGPEMKKQKFWEIYGGKRKVSDEEAVKRMDNLLEEGARKLVRKSDGPINIFLSGGFDSVFLTQLVSDVSDRSINTYTWGWEPEHFQDARKMAERYGTSHHEIDQDYSLPSGEEVWFYEEPHNAFARYPFRELYLDRGMKSYWTGLNSQATFPVCLKNVRKLDRYRSVEPVIKSLPTGKMKDLVGSRIDYQLGKAIQIFESDYRSEAAVNDWSMRKDQAMEMLSDDLREETVDIARKLDRNWCLKKKSYAENYSYLQLRARDTARYAYYSQDMEHMDIFGYIPLLEYSYSLPMKQKKNRRILQKIAEGRIPESIITKGASGWHFVSEQFRKMILNEREKYEQTVDRFLDREYLDRDKAEEMLIRSSYENLSKGEVNQMISVYLLERWLQIFIDRDEPWKQPN